MDNTSKTYCISLCGVVEVAIVDIQGNVYRDEDPTFFSTDPTPAQLGKNPDPTPDPTLNRNEEKICLYIR